MAHRILDDFHLSIGLGGVALLRFFIKVCFCRAELACSADYFMVLSSMLLIIELFCNINE